MRVRHLQQLRTQPLDLIAKRDADRKPGLPLEQIHRMQLVSIAASSNPLRRSPSAMWTASQSCSHATVISAPSAVFEIAFFGGCAVIPARHNFCRPHSVGRAKERAHVIHAAYVVE